MPKQKLNIYIYTCLDITCIYLDIFMLYEKLFGLRPNQFFIFLCLLKTEHRLIVWVEAQTNFIYMFTYKLKIE